MDEQLHPTDIQWDRITYPCPIHLFCICSLLCHTPLSASGCNTIAYITRQVTYNIMPLTHWGRLMHICIGKLTIIGSDNGLSPGKCQTIIWNNAGISLIGHLGTDFSEILIEIYTFPFKKMYLKMLSRKWRPSCLGLNALTLRCFYASRSSLFQIMANCLFGTKPLSKEIFRHHCVNVRVYYSTEILWKSFNKIHFMLFYGGKSQSWSTLR